VLAVGTELGETDYDVVFDDGFGIDGKLIRIDIDAQQVMRNFRPDVAIAADAKLVLAALDHRLATRPLPPRMPVWARPRVGAARAALNAGTTHRFVRRRRSSTPY